VDTVTAAAIGRAVILGAPWPPADVADTAENRDFRDVVAGQVADLIAAGITPDLPGTWPAP
jgi:hypothetical protein